MTTIVCSFLFSLFLAPAAVAKPVTIDSGAGYSAAYSGPGWSYLRVNPPARLGPPKALFVGALSLMFVNDLTEDIIMFQVEDKASEPDELLKLHQKMAVGHGLEMLSFGKGVPAFYFKSPPDMDGPAAILAAAFRKVGPLTLVVYGAWSEEHHQQRVADMKRFVQSLKYVAPPKAKKNKPAPKKEKR